MVFILNILDNLLHQITPQHPNFDLGVSIAHANHESKGARCAYSQLARKEICEKPYSRCRGKGAWEEEALEELPDATSMGGVGIFLWEMEVSRDTTGEKTIRNARN